jgi:flagellar hook protein FlgE
MLLSLDSGISALDQFQQSLNVIANNIANVETVGFKGATVNFADTLSQTLSGPGASGTMQIGTGIHTASIANQFTQGSVTTTGVPNDLAISGNGFFLVNDPTTGSAYVTRDGQFSVDANGYLLTNSGMRVQGYNDAGLTTIGDIKIDNAGSGSTALVQSYSFSDTGKLTVSLADGTTFTRGQVLLQNCSSPQQLTKVGNNLYSGLAFAGALAAPVAPGTSGVGKIAAGSLEMSNVDLASQLASLIVTQRAYEANTKVITTSDEILQALVNLKR